MARPRLYAATLRSAVVAALALGLACGGGAGSASQTAMSAPDISIQLQQVPGVVSVQEEPLTDTPARAFLIGFTQREDHASASSPTFVQQVRLYFGSRTRPVIVSSTPGASSVAMVQFDPESPIQYIPRLDEPTELLDNKVNQLGFEPRFSGTSVPADRDWTKLTLQQMAADEHAIIQAFKPLLSGRWVSTERSGLGLAALMHRRLYPNDVSGTVIYKASIPLSLSDGRYADSIAAEFGSAVRQSIKAWQQAVLDNRAAVLSLFEADQASQSFNMIGSPDRALEFAVLDAPRNFMLNLYYQWDNLQQIPGPGATPQQLYDFLRAVDSYDPDNTPYPYTDAQLLHYASSCDPSSYLVCTQIGNPAVDDSGLTGLAYPGEDTPGLYLPAGVAATYDGGATMQDLQDWLVNSADSVLLIDAPNDLWRTGLPDLSSSQTRNVWSLVTPYQSTNPDASILKLSDTDQQNALALLKSWTGQ